MPLNKKIPKRGFFVLCQLVLTKRLKYDILTCWLAPKGLFLFTERR